MPNIPLSRGGAHDMSAEYARRGGTPADRVRINSFFGGVYAQWQRGDIRVGFGPTETAVHRIQERLDLKIVPYRSSQWQQIQRIQRDADVPALQKGVVDFLVQGSEKQEIEDAVGTNA